MAQAVERYTYRRYRDRRPEEIHFDTLEKAVLRATQDMEEYAAVPVEIRSGKTVVLNEGDITAEWEERYLKT